MDTLHLPDPKPLMIAHRGCSGLELENTVPAFEAAGQRSYWGIETDVHVTRDGRFIVIHDDTTGRVALENLPVEGADYETLRSLRLKDRADAQSQKRLILPFPRRKNQDSKPGKNNQTPFSPQRSNQNSAPGQTAIRLPSLGEYLQICKKYGKFSVLELKNPMEADAIHGIVDEVAAEGWLEHTVFISFSLDNLIRLRARLPRQKAQLLVNKPTFGLFGTLRRYQLDLDIKARLLTKGLVRRARNAGVKINVWTVDDPAAARRFADWGVQYITSNIIE